MVYQTVMVQEEERKVMGKNNKCLLIYKRKVQHIAIMIQVIIIKTNLEQMVEITCTKEHSNPTGKAHQKVQKRRVNNTTLMINIIKMSIHKIVIFIHHWDILQKNQTQGKKVVMDQ